MTRWLLSAIIMIGIPAYGQISLEEAKARLEARQRQRTTQPAATRPAAPPRANTAKAAEKRKVLRLKQGAPNLVRQWFDSLGSYKAQAIFQIQEEIDARQQRIDAMYKQPLPLRKVGSNSHGIPEMRPDNQAATERSNAARQLRGEILTLKKKIKQVEDDKTFIYVPPFGFEMGNFGSAEGMEFKISQVIDDSNVIATCGEHRVWMKGFDAKNRVDGAVVHYSGTIICSGSKSYTSVLGAKQTVLLIEPLDYEPWVEIVEEEVTP